MGLIRGDIYDATSSIQLAKMKEKDPKIEHNSQKRKCRPKYKSHQAKIIQTFIGLIQGDIYDATTSINMPK